MDAIPKGPTGKPKRIGLANLLQIPGLVDPQDLRTYSITGTEGNFGQLQWITKSIFHKTDHTVPAWTFPLTLTLDVHPDLGDYHRQFHSLVIKDSLCTDAKLTVTTYACGGKPHVVEVPITEAQVKEALFYVKMRIVEHPLEWKSPMAEGQQSSYDYCCYLIVTDGKVTMDHQWEMNCHWPPPGALIRLLKVNECTAGTEFHPVPDEKE